MTKGKATTWLIILGVAVICIFAFSIFPSIGIGYNDFKSPAAALTRGADFNGGAVSYYVVEKDSIEDLTHDEIISKLSVAVDVIYKRAKDFGFREAFVAAADNGDGSYGMIVKTAYLPERFANNVDAHSALEYYNTFFGSAGKLEIRERDAEGKEVKVKDDNGNDILAGDNVKGTKIVYNGGWQVEVTFNSKGVKALKERSEKLLGSQLHFMIDGESKATYSVQSIIKSSRLTLTFEDQEPASSFHAFVNNGFYDLTFNKTSASESFETGNFAGDGVYLAIMIILAVVLVAAITFMIIKFRMFGVGAALSLLGFAGVTLVALSLLPFIQVTLASGIGLLIGLCLTCGFNIFLLSSVTAKYTDEGKSFKRSIEEGFKAAAMTVVDVCAVAFLFSVGLWIFSPASFFGLASMLFVSIIASAASSLFLTRLFVGLLGAVYSDNLKLFNLTPNASVKGGRSK